MKKIINAPENYVDEMLNGIYKAHPDQVTYVGKDKKCYVTKYKQKGKVGIATGGGSGHLPLFLGYCGRGMLDGCCVGEVFQSPSSDQMLEVTKEIDSGAGVLYIYGNYNGDIFNFDMAAEMADMEDIRVETVIGNDDIAGTDNPSKRRGVAGIFFAYKCAGAAAYQGKNLDEVKNAAEKAVRNTRTIGLALSPCIVPRVGKASFSIKADEMEMGMGIHGEPGISVEKMKTADKIVDDMMNALLKDLPLKCGDETAILVNGLGATPLDELYIMLNHIEEILKLRDIGIYKVYVGEYATSMEMAGASISLCKVDDELKLYLSEEADTPFFKQFKF